MSPDIDYVFRDESGNELFRERRRYGLKQNTVALGRLDEMTPCLRMGVDGIRNVLLNLDHTFCKAGARCYSRKRCKDAVRIDSLGLE